MRPKDRSITNTFVSVVLIGLCTALFTLCHRADDHRIGAVLPLTGSAAVWGQNARRGMDLAFTELNSSRTPAERISVIYEDSRSDPTSAVSALQKLITVDQIQVVIGDIDSSSVLAMAPIANANKVLLLSPGASNPAISNAGQFIFRNWQSDALEGNIDAKFAYSTRGWRQMATLYVDNAYGVGLNTEFSRDFVALGGKIVAQEGYPQGSTDLRASITRLLSDKFDALYLPGYPPEMVVALRQIKELGLSTPTLSVQAFDDPEILKRAGSAAEGVIYSVPKPPSDTDPVTASFKSSYLATYHVAPGVCSDTGFDAVRIIAYALDHGARTGEQIRTQLTELRNFPGAAGPTTFDAHGDVARPFRFMVIKSGKPVISTE